MIVESILISLIVGKFRKGKILKIFNHRIKAWYLFLIAAILEFGSTYFYNSNVYNFGTYINSYFIIIQCVVYILILVGLIVNFKYKSMIVVFCGTIFNFIVAMFNGGKVPISVDALSYLGFTAKIKLLEAGKILTQVISSQVTKLEFLGDIIPIPYPYFSKIISIGDIIIAIGIFILIQKMMVNKNTFGNTCNMIEFDYLAR